MTELYGSICLSDIDKSLIREGKNGKKYLSVVIGKRRQPSAYGHTHYIKMYVKKEERKDGANYYIGELKPSEYQQPQAQPQQYPAPTAENFGTEDVPF